MRRQIWIGVIAVAVGGVAGYWHFSQEVPEPFSPAPFTPQLKPRQIMPPAKDDGGAEASEVVEPLIVDRGPQGTEVFTEAPAAPPPPPSRVALTPDMKQPPRPDAIPGQTVRMPYADEPR